LVLAGEFFRMAVIGYAYIRRGGKDRQVHANLLVTRGFYAHSRNPMYVANYMIVLGLGFVYGSAPVLAFIALFFAWVYLAITVAEETFLRERFGAEYDAYAARVNRFLPDFRGLGQSLSEFAYDWRRALVKEYNTLCFTLAGVLGLSAWKAWHLHGYEADKDRIVLLLGFMLPVAVLYGTVRFLKKTRRLRPSRLEESEEDLQPS
jgi:hypothetical protein